MAPTQLQIKVNALTRLIKEEGLYRKEAQDYKTKIEQMKSNSADHYEIKKMQEVLQDTEKMIPDIRQKVKSTLDSLEAFLATGDIAEDTSAAKAKVEEAKKFLETN